jgi:CDP-glucose 4,6-dehydratase
MIQPAFWQGKRVFLTGHTGFKGGWLSIWLAELGAEVVGFALPPPTEPSLFEVAGLARRMNSIIGDIRDADALRSALHEAQPEIVIHMAAQPLVRLSYNQPAETYATNVMGLVHLFEAVRKCNSVRAVVNVTSDKCYENKEWVWGYRESEPMGGYDPYSSSKGCAELVTTAYRNSFFNPENYQTHGVALASARAGNVIGGGDWALDRLIPDIMRAIEAGIPVQIRNPAAIRPWQHVLEPLGGYLCLAQKLYEAGPAFVGGWNFGPAESDAKPVQWIVDRMTRMWGEGASWQDVMDHTAPHEAHYLKLDCSKAQSLLGWKPAWNLERALEKIIDWHHSSLQGADLHAKTLGQIRDYQADFFKTVAP